MVTGIEGELKEEGEESLRKGGVREREMKDRKTGVSEGNYFK